MSRARLLASYLAHQREAGLGEAFLSRMKASEFMTIAEEIKAEETIAVGAGSAAGKANVAGVGAGSASAVANPSARSSGLLPDDEREAINRMGGELPSSHDDLRDVALVCERCALAGGRTRVVFNDGVRNAQVMVVGEAPGAREDATGTPFVGPAGKLLDLLLATVGLSRTDNVYIANVLKCRPPGNRNPHPREIESCSPFLLRQIEIVRPRIILAVGAFSGRLLTARERSPLSKLRGKVHRYMDRPLVVTYHPAALLRNPRWIQATWTDLQLLRRELGGS